MPGRSRHPPLERRRRRIARVALYSSLVVTLAGSAVVYHLVRPVIGDVPEAAWMGTDWSADPSVRLLRHYLRIDSTADRGDEYAAALYLAAPLEAAGLEVTIERLGARSGHARSGHARSGQWNANLWATLEPGASTRPAASGHQGRPQPPEAAALRGGRGAGSRDVPRPRDTLILHSHLDTEPIRDPDSWHHAPHGGEIESAWIFGRGAFDMKSYTVAQLEAVLERARAAREGEPPARPIRLLATSGEETGSVLGTRWLLSQHPELFDDAWALLTEGGVVEATSVADVKYWGTAFGQKRFLELTACAPTAERLERLRDEVAERRDLLLEHPDHLRLTEPVRTFLAVYWPSRTIRPLRQALRHPERLLRDAARFLDLPPYVQALLRDDVSVFPPVPSPEPTVDGSHQARVVVHLLPGSDADQVRERLLPAWLTAGIELTVDEPPAPVAASPVDHPAFEAIQAELRAEFPAAPIGPYFLPWTKTDARFSRAAGVPTYGFSPFLILTPDTLTMAAADERIALEGFAAGVERYVRVVARLAG